MNHVVLLGRTTKDAELRYIPGSGTPVANFTIAIDRDYKKQDGSKDTDFIPVEVMGKVAEFVANHINKGRLVAVHGSIRIDRYMKDDENRTFTKVSAKSVQALESIKKSEENNQTFTPSYEPPTGLDPEGFQAINDDEIPF